MGKPHEAEARVDHQGRARDEECVGAGQCLARVLVTVAGDVLTEKDDVRLEKAAALLAARRHERLDDSRVDVGVAVRSGSRVGLPARVGGGDRFLQR